MQITKPDIENIENIEHIKHIENIKIIKQIKQIKQKIINVEEQCSGRIWNDSIFSRKTQKKIDNIENKYKVLDYKHIDLKEFNKLYIIGSRCSNTKIKEGKYCKLHLKHLIHGDYLEIPSKELCYHFIKDGKYL